MTRSPALIINDKKLEMKKLTILIVVVMSVLSVSARGGVEWITSDVDFGVIKEAEGVSSREISFVNSGDEDISIVRVRTSCGCTTTGFPKEVIAPGDTASMTVTYDPTGRPGKFEKKVTVYFSSEDIDTQSFKIHGVVIGTDATMRRRYPVDGGELKLRSDIVAFGTVNKSRLKSDFVEIYNATVDTLNPMWSDIPEYISVNPREGRVAPGEQRVYNVMINGLKAPVYGLLVDSMYIRATESGKPVKIELIANLEEDFSRLTAEELRNAPVITLSADKLDFGVISSGEKQECSFTISNSGKDELQLRRVYSSDAGVEVDVNRSKIKRGKEAEVTVRVDPSSVSGGVLNARVIVISNDPSNPVVEVRVVGMVE